MDNEQQIQHDAINLLATMRTRGWVVAEALLDAALLNIQDRVFTTDTHNIDHTAVLTIRAQGARELVETFKSALRAASEVEMPEPTAGLAQESNDSAD